MKNLSTLFIVSLVAVALGGCASSSYRPPITYTKEIGREYDHSYQTSWDAVLDMVTASGFKLDQVSKDSGYISIAHRLKVKSTEMDCGLYKSGDLVRLYKDDSTANLAVRFKELARNRSHVSVVVTGERIITGINQWDGAFLNETYQCESTSELESMVLDYVANYKD